MRDILLIIMFVLLWAKNAYGLKLALQLRCAVKTNSLIQCPAEIIWTFGTSSISAFCTKYAGAVFSFNGKQIRSSMICVCDYKLIKGHKVTVIFPEGNPKIFALSKQHIKNAVLTYGVLTVVFALLSISTTIIYLLAFYRR